MDKQGSGRGIWLDLFARVARNRKTVTWLGGGSVAALTIAVAASATQNAISSTSSFAGSTVLAGSVALAVALPLLYTCRRMSTRIEALRREAQRLAQRDPLTACLNEHTFSALVDTYADRRSSREGAPHGTALLIHLDDIQVVNKRFGYSWGNEALARVAATIRGAIRQGDIVGRTSGNQFGVFLPGADEESARSVAERIHNSVSSLGFYPSGVRYPLSIRAGAVIVLEKTGFDDLIRNAENILAVSRNDERDWIHYTSSIGSPLDTTAKLQ